jgi:hypothetical protein
MTTEPVVTPENTPEVPKAQAAPVSAPEETPEQINWRKFRQERAVERKQKEESEKKAAESAKEAAALKAAMEALINRNQPQETPSNQYEDKTDEQKIQEKIDAALSARERVWEQQRAQKEHAEFPKRLAANFKDFNEVCTTENLDYMEFHYPEVAEPFKHLPDSYDKWASIYKAVKRFVPNPSDSKDRKKAEINNKKPQSMSVPGATQTGDSAPHVLDDKKRADNWARMQRVMRGGK